MYFKQASIIDFLSGCVYYVF